MTFRASPLLVGDYLRLFVNRRAYTVQSARPHPESGRHYYYRPTDKKIGGGLSLTTETPLPPPGRRNHHRVIHDQPRHAGVQVDCDHTDYKNVLEDLLKLNYYLSRDKVHGALEKSRRGGHLWVFFESPQPARSCRIYVYDLVLRLGVPVKGGSCPLQQSTCSWTSRLERRYCACNLGYRRVSPTFVEDWSR